MENRSERDELLSIYSDTFKDVNGFRPRGELFPSNLTTEEIQAKLDTLQAELDEQLADEDANGDWRDDADDEDDYDDSMDGDFDSGMASAGFGTDEDYGCYGDDY